MAQSMHSSNSQDQKMKEYKAVAALININNVADRIEINYTRLDSVSAGRLKDTIAKTLHGFSLIDEITGDTKEYIAKLSKQNTTSSIDIDFAKLDKDNEELLLAYQLKSAIKEVLTERKRAIYTSLTLNTNY